MTQLPSYQTQFNKITEAYIKGEIQPYNESFCFCGTLAGSDEWSSRRAKDLPYTYREFGLMEQGLFSTFPTVKWEDNGCLNGNFIDQDDPNFEEYLFNGMCAALDVLKQIHRERGEVIDDAPVFQKRKELIKL